MDIPLNPEQPEPRTLQLRPDLKVHATTDKNVQRILSEGLKTRQETFCKVWGAERIPYGVQKSGKIKDVLQCREEGVFMWDDLQSGMEQALATVGYLKSGDPAILVINTEGLKLEQDPEMEFSEEDPQSLVHRGHIDRSRVECFCTLTVDVRPDTGKLLCRTMHEEGECELTSAEEIYETLTTPENWACFCRNPL